MVTMEEILAKFNLTNERIWPGIMIFNFKENFQKFEIEKYFEFGNEHTILKFQYFGNDYNSELILDFFNVYEYMTYKKIFPNGAEKIKIYDYEANPRIKIKDIIKNAGLSFRLPERIENFCEHDHNYKLDSEYVDKNGFKNYKFIAKNPTRGHDEMIIISPDDKKSTVYIENVFNDEDDYVYAENISWDGENDWET